MWKCTCGETNEHQFAWCWKCSEARPDDVPRAPRPAPAAPASRPRLGPGHALKAFVLWGAITSAVGYLLAPFAGEDAGWYFIVAQPAACSVLVWLMTRGHGVPWREVLPVAPPDPRAAIAAAALALGLAVTTTWLLDVLLAHTDLGPWLDRWPDNPTDAQFDGAGVVENFLSAVVTAPLCEETIFRGVLLTALLAGWPTRRAIVVTALLFAVLHIHPVGMISALLLGLVAGWQRAAFGTLWLSVISHAVYNLHVLAWHHSPWMPDLAPLVWILLGVLLILVGYDRLVQRRPRATSQTVSARPGP